MSDGPQLSVRPAGSPGPARLPAPLTPRLPDAFGRARSAFRTWRRTRPFWGGFWCLLGGVAMAYGPATVIKLILVSTAVWQGTTVGVLVGLMGLFLWFAPRQRHLAGILAVLLSVLSLLTSNYGGFLIGLIMGTVGGALGFAWTPVKPETQATAPEPPPSPEAT